MSKKYTVNQGFDSCPCQPIIWRMTAPTSNTASHDNHEKISSWVTFSFLSGYGVPLGGPWGRRSSATNKQHAQSHARFFSYHALSLWVFFTVHTLLEHDLHFVDEFSPVPELYFLPASYRG